MDSLTHFDRLFQPIRLGRVEIRNRIVMPPMATNFASQEGYVTEQLKGYYEERARGGVGLIIVEFSCINPATGKGILKQLGIDNDKLIPGLSGLARVIQKHGARAAIQLCHAGRLTQSRFSNCQPVGPSPIPELGGEMPRELSLGEIEDIIADFAKGAERAQKAGFDGVELHCTHGYLLNQFLSAASNKRHDAYGGDLRNRARLLLDTTTAVRDKVGADYPVWVRLTGVEFDTENGITLEQSQQVARWLEEVGVVAISVSARRGRPAHAMTWMVAGEEMPRPPMDHPVGFLVPVAEAIKRVVSVPVMVMSRMNPEMGEKVLREGKADMVVMGRSLIADPELPAKAASGRLEDIRPCIACLLCRERWIVDEGVSCTVNAAVGREKERPEPVQKKKRVMVVGGGPAGMEAARVAALRGHQVTLWDKGESLGGQLLVASIPPHKGELARLTNYLATQLSKLGVKVEQGREATPELVLAAQPDVVIVATGAIPLTPHLPGSEGARLVDAQDVLTGKAEVGATVVIIGGGVVGCETAEFLAKKGKKVTIVEMLDALAEEMEAVHKQYLQDRLRGLGVTTLTGTKVEAVTEKGPVISIKEGPGQVVETDTIVLATGAKPNQELYRALLGQVPEVHLIGDCLQPHRITEAIAQGFDVGRQI